MFISTGMLGIQYGVDDKIAKFFVDREPPAHNLYWKDKFLYLQPSSGYLFIPLIVDILYRTGIERQQLLSNRFVACMEQVGHISALEETKQIDHGRAIDLCISVAKESCLNGNWLHQVTGYSTQMAGNIFSRHATPFKSLHRGDQFLFSLAALDFAEELFETIAERWFALITSLLMLDDIEDIDVDIMNNEENAFIESGVDNKGIKQVEELIHINLNILTSVNAIMAMNLNEQFKELINRLRVRGLQKK